MEIEFPNPKTFLLALLLLTGLVFSLISLVWWAIFRLYDYSPNTEANGAFTILFLLGLGIMILSVGLWIYDKERKGS